MGDCYRERELKRIAIITFHRTSNYGAALQTFALQTKLSNKYTVDILDYRNSYLEKNYLAKTNSFSEKARVIVRRLVYPVKTRRLDIRRKRFELFYKKFHVLSNIIYNADNIRTASDNYDAFIVGSDQVWNLHLSRNDWNYFLEFAPPLKRYSYAASISIKNTAEINHRIQRDLNEFQSILVRENTAVSFLQSIGVNKQVIAVCDPVFLMSADEWEKNLPIAVGNNTGKHILLYTVANVQESLDFAKKLGMYNKLPVISISSNQSVKTVDGVVNIFDAGPIEFLRYIREAAYVVTSSFHAMAFSIIFNVPFYYELCRDGSNNNDRLENVAEIFHLQDRNINNVKSESDSNDINWDEVNSLLKGYRDISATLLLDSLKNIRGEINEQIYKKGE